MGPIPTLIYKLTLVDNGNLTLVFPETYVGRAEYSSLSRFYSILCANVRGLGIIRCGSMSIASKDVREFLGKYLNE